MRTRAPLATPRSIETIWSEQDDEIANRTRSALRDALEELDLPEGTPDETVKILRLPDSF